MPTYLNFDLELFGRRAEGGRLMWKVRVLESPGGEQGADQAETVTVDMGLPGRVGDDWIVGRSPGELAEIGAELGDLLFPGKVWNIFLDSQGQLGAGEGLRIRIRTTDQELASIPWEYAWAGSPGPEGQREPDSYLALDPKLSIVRHVPRAQRVPRMAPLWGRARMLAFFSTPVGASDTLNVAAEGEALEKAFRFTRTTVVSPLAGTRSALRAALEGRFHVFHFGGHGRFEETRSDDGLSTGERYYLRVRSDGGVAEDYPADVLGEELRGRGVRLAVLNACESGRAAWSGIASNLVRRGVPAVVAMQDPVSDAAAIRFTERFYPALLSGGTIDDAVRAGRRSMSSGSPEAVNEWGIPKLYLRAEGDVLFPVGRLPLSVNTGSASLGLLLMLTWLFLHGTPLRAVWTFALPVLAVWSALVVVASIFFKTQIRGIGVRVLRSRRTMIPGLLGFLLCVGLFASASTVVVERVGGPSGAAYVLDLSSANVHGVLWDPDTLRLDPGEGAAGGLVLVSPATLLRPRLPDISVIEPAAYRMRPRRLGPLTPLHLQVPDSLVSSLAFVRFVFGPSVQNTLPLATDQTPVSRSLRLVLVGRDSRDTVLVERLRRQPLAVGVLPIDGTLLRRRMEADGLTERFRRELTDHFGGREFDDLSAPEALVDFWMEGAPQRAVFVSAFSADTVRLELLADGEPIMLRCAYSLVAGESQQVVIDGRDQEHCSGIPE